MDIDRYLKITKWLKNRYSENGMIVTFSKGKETKYTVLEREFFKKYITCSRS